MESKTIAPIEYDILGLNYNSEYKPDTAKTLSYYDTLKHLQDLEMSSKVIFAPHELKTMAANGFKKNEIENMKKPKQDQETPHKDFTSLKYHNYLDLQNTSKNSSLNINSLSSSSSSASVNPPNSIIPKPNLYSHLLLKTTNIPPSDLKQYDTYDLTEYSNNNDMNNSDMDKKYEKQEAYEVYMKYESRAL